MNKAIFVFLSSFACCFFSCQTEVDSQSVQVSPLTSETGEKAFAVKDASYVIHYKQKVLKNLDDELYVTSTNDGFEQAAAEDKSVKAFTQLKTLAKNYEGFSFSNAVQKDSTILIYYTRNEVVYSFYKDANTLSKQVSGVYGLTCRPPNILIGQNVVTKWNSSSDGSGSEIPAEFGAVDASYYANGTGIGTKYSPDTAGDIVFTDGTAATTEEVRAATGDQKDTYKTNALAVIIFDKYNTYSGSPYDGKKVIGVGVRALDLDIPDTDETKYFLCKWKDSESIPRQEIEFRSNHGYYDLQKLLELYPDNNDSRDTYWRAIWRATKYIEKCKEKITTDISNNVSDNWYLPCWRELGVTLANNFKYYDVLKKACLAIEIGDIISGKDFWTTPNMYVDNQTTFDFYAAYVKAGNDWAQLDYTLYEIGVDPTVEPDKAPNDKQWKKRSDIEVSSWVLPFKEFK